MLEKEQLEQTPLWSPIAGDYQFIAVDRDKNSRSDGASNNVDFVIIRRAISSAQAMDVLDLLMMCYVNESLDAATNLTVYEEAILYTYVSTKIDEIKAVKMNLHVDVLGYVPYFSDYKNSEQGQEPNNKTKFTATFILVVVGIIAAIVVCAVLAVYSGGGTALVMIGLICMLIYMLDAYLPGIAEILTMITAFMIELVMTILTWLGPLGWLILRAAFLILVWIHFSEMLFYTTLILFAMTGILYVLNAFIDLTINSNYNEVNVEGIIDLTFGYSIGQNYFEFFDINYPTLEIYFEAFDFSIGYLSSFFSEDISINLFPKDLLDDLYESNPSGSAENQPKSSGSSSNTELICDFLTGMGVAAGLAGGTVSAISLVKKIRGSKDTYQYDPVYKKIEIAAMIAFAISFGILIATMIIEEPSFWSYIGLGLGFFISGVYFIKVGLKDIKYGGHYMKNARIKSANLGKIFIAMVAFDTIATFIDLGLNIIGLFEILAGDFGEGWDITITSWSLTTGALALILAKYSLIEFGGQDSISKKNFCGYNRNDKFQFSILFGMLFISIGCAVIMYGNDQKDS